jgi:predicted O-methyltransferase YrrM
MAQTIRLDMTRYDLPQLADTLGTKRGAEIGVNHGWFSYYLLRHSHLEELWSVDPYLGKYARLIDDASSLLSEFGDRSRLVRATSEEAAILATKGREQFGFIYIDGDHTLPAVTKDITDWLPLLARPGILGGHDYITGIRKVNVIPAVHAIADEHGLPIYLTREAWASWFLIFGAA